MPRVRALSPDAAVRNGDGVQAIVLVLRILEHLAGEPEPLGVTAIANALGTTKSRIHRHLRTLVNQGYIVQAGDSERYRVGLRFMRLSRMVSDRFDLVGAAQEAARELRDALGHSTVVSQVEPEGIRVLATLSARSMMEIGVKRGSLLGFHYSAQGKIALAFGDEELRARVFRSRLEMMSPKTIISTRVLRGQIERIRRQGWAVAPGEAALGINALAAPIFDATGALVGTVAIVDSIQYIQEEPSEEQIDYTVKAARKVSEALGASPAGPQRGELARTG